MRKLLTLITILALTTVGCASTTETYSLTGESADALNYDPGVGVQIEVENTDARVAPRLRAKVTNSAKNDGSRIPATGYTYVAAGGVQYNFPNAFLEVGYEYYGYRSRFGDGRPEWRADDDSLYYRAGFRWLNNTAELSATYFPSADTIYDANTFLVTYQVDFTINDDPTDWRNRLSIFIEPSFTTLNIPNTGERQTRSAATFGMGIRF